MDIVSATKTCSKCGQVKPLAEFRKMHGKDGQPCLMCHREANAKWRAENAGKMQAARDAWLAKPENKARHKETERQRYQRDKTRIVSVQKVYLKNNRDKRLEWRRRNYRANIGKERLRSKRYKLEHPDRVRKTMTHWRINHRDSAREYDNRRRSKLMGCEINDFTARQWRELKEKYNHRCAYCGKISEHLQQDHVIPISKNGNHTLSNIVPACKSCNCKKKDHTLSEVGMKFVVVV